jgi:hypothetical protein
MSKLTPSATEVLDPMVDAITNSTMQEIAKSLLRQDGLGRLGDSRALCTAVREVVNRNIRKTVELHPKLDPATATQLGGNL